MSSKTSSLIAMLVLSACGSESDDTTDPTENTSAPTTTAPTTTAPSTSGTDDSTSGNATTTSDVDESSGDDSSGDHGSSGHDSGSGTDSHGTTGGSMCDILGDGCHDNMTPEGIECHLIGHDGDEAACAEVFEMCVATCGL